MKTKEINFDKHPKKKTVKKKRELVKILFEMGYLPDFNGDWLGSGQIFLLRMFKHCGQEPPKKYSWREEWLEGAE